MKKNPVIGIYLFLFGIVFVGLTCSYPDVAPPRPREYAYRRPLRVVYGKASYYGSDFHGKKTASGEVFDQHGLTAAHKTWPFGTVCRVTNRKNSKSVIVRINDRGPFVAGRILDLSYGAAQKIEGTLHGVIDVEIEILEWGKE
jgi:rare lipoprotein A